MAGTRRWALILVAALATPAGASAGQTAPVETRQWDVGADLAWLPASSLFLPFFLPLTQGWGVEGSRYWTAHLKTGVALVGHSGATLVATDVSISNGTYRYERQYAKPLGYATFASYQFFENEFVHPYLSGGIQILPAVSTVFINGGSSSSETTRTIVRRAAFVAGGFKSYFANGRSFVRTELLVPVPAGGVSHVTVRFGIGFDF